MKFKIEDENQIQNVETYSFEVKSPIDQTFNKVSVTRASFVNLYVAKHGNKIHCGLIARNDFQVENKNSSFWLWISYLIVLKILSYDVIFTILLRAVRTCSKKYTQAMLV